MNNLNTGRLAQGTLATSLTWLYLYAGMGAKALPSTDLEGSFLRIFVSLGLIVFYLLTFVSPSILSNRTKRLPCAFVLSGLLALVAIAELAQPSLLTAAPVSYASFFLQGLCLGLAYAQMGVFLFLLPGREAALSLAAAMTVGAAGNLLLDFVAPVTNGFILKVVLILAALSFLGIAFDDEERVQPSEMFREYPETRPLFSELFFISILYGFMVMFSSIAVTASQASAMAFGVAYLLPAAALLLMVLIFNVRIGFLSLRWIVVPAMTAIIVPLTIIPVAEGFVLIAAVLALFQTLEASSTLSLTESAREHGIPPISSFVLLRLVGTLGLLVGRLACIGVTLSSIETSPELLFKIAIAALIIILVVWRTVISFNDANLNVARPAESSIGSSRNSLSGGGATWQSERDEQLRSLAVQCSLSERETEVFLLLSKGRNAEYIGKDLYISENTVRSHIQRIYRKLDTHSQQELLDFIERAI